MTSAALQSTDNILAATASDGSTRDHDAAHAATEKTIKHPPYFGFVVTRYPYCGIASYEEAVEARENVAAKSRRPVKFMVMKELTRAGTVSFFVTNYSYKQARSLAEARRYLAAPDRPRPESERRKKKRHRSKPDEKRIRFIINCSGAPEPQLVEQARRFFLAELSAATDLNDKEREALYG